MNFENQAHIGYGIFTIPDIAKILNLKYSKVSRLLNEYWDKRIANSFDNSYSWKKNKSKAVSFHTLVEFYVYFQLREAGISTANILKAHNELNIKFDTAFPFANSKILKNISVLGKSIIFKIGEDIYMNLDASNQLNLKFIAEFFKKLDFDENEIANRFWPMGKKSSIVIDPAHQFGQPIIQNTNIASDAIFSMFKAKEPISFISATYSITEKQVNDVVSYHNKKAA